MPHAPSPARVGPVRWHPGHLAALMFVGFYLLIQLAVPTVRLFSPTIERYGWQMFARVGPRTTYHLVLDDGRRQEIDPSGYLGVWRGDMDLSAHLPPSLCRANAEARAVQIQRDHAAPETHPCR